ncbi:GNAT family N-acetyltransferase [Nonomuraea gerenzanensis]|uniref:GCN5-related N-acetyltransferase n=1 Tax=Nonomuraea gerenzanensis TaxID=93944 RepID=A0A1M4EA50_9ACTN|nr:GNAT family N-acetyltransferase [Nonomuraea gerenzanensis]UBU17699.1 GNAT family N-acetyltransferase [Nonomuraea gerenzanensis]SBO95473.1 GCN5-related N-acetyltransferase [Nonomuraea gerenzanensis]
MHTIRRPRVDDAAAIHELVATCDTAVIGAPDSTLDDIADELVEPGFDRDRDGWLAHDAGGRADGYAWACRNGDSDLVDVEVIVRPGVDGLADELWPAVLARAAELGAERGHDTVTLHIGVYRTDEAKRARVEALGFEPGTSYHRMRIDHDGPVEPPAAPAGLTLHSGESEEVRREGHHVHQEGFAEHFGFVPVGYEQWYERRQASSATDWSQLTLARLDGRPAAVLIGNNQFVSDEGCGYVATLAVLPAYRGRGLGRFLLKHAFAADAARGRKGTILHVDSNNTTPALGLYESAGMRLVMAIDVWRRRLP